MEVLGLDGSAFALDVDLNWTAADLARRVEEKIFLEPGGTA